MKKVCAILSALCIMLGVFAACGEDTASSTASAPEETAAVSEETAPVSEAPEEPGSVQEPAEESAVESSAAEGAWKLRTLRFPCR